MKSFNILLTLVFLLINTALSQSPYTNVLIRSASYGEVSIEINPKNINNLAAGCNINLSSWTSDGGITWTNGTISNSSWGVWGDPVLTADTNGHFYYSHLSNTTQPPGYWIDRIVIQKSANGGVNWSNPGSYTFFNPPKEQDKQWMAVDFSHGPRGNWIYCTWTQFDNYGSSNTNDSSNILFARSTDGGLSWVGVGRLNKLAGNCIDGDYTVEGATPSVGPNGELYVAWAGPLSTNNFRIFFDKSSDGGNTWLANDIVVANQPGGWDFDIAGINRSNGLPFSACDYSNGPYRGTVYINWTDSLAPGDHDIKIVKSTNGGLNWTAPLRVNNDVPGKEQFLTAMTIDQVTGFIYIVFYDRRNYTDNQTDVFLARSTNGGASFTNERISASPFVPSSGPFFGDYIDIAAHNGRVRPIWQRLQGGSISLYTALIDFPLGVTQTNNEIPVQFSLSQNYPNPFNPETKIRFSVPEKNQVRIKVFNTLGKETATLVSEEYNAGNYEVIWDASDYPSGVYFYQMTSGNFTETKRMVLSK